MCQPHTQAEAKVDRDPLEPAAAPFRRAVTRCRPTHGPQAIPLAGVASARPAGAKMATARRREPRSLRAYFEVVGVNIHK